mmetsp:Transcript_49567/g.140398  ORF Transcript_49567/g.140398 Transcript_49567/m.140398 type:complete len:267 (-) Transcript_49567:382-1182(-)
MKKVVDVTMELTQTSDELKVKSAALSGSLTNATDLRQKLDTATADLTASRARVAELVAAKQEVDDELKRERLDQVEMETKINELQKKLDHAEYMQRVKEDQLMKARGDLTYANEEKRYKDSDIADLKRQLSELTLECQFKTDEKTRLEARDVQLNSQLGNIEEELIATQHQLQLSTKREMEMRGHMFFKTDMTTATLQAYQVPLPKLQRDPSDPASPRRLKRGLRPKSRHEEGLRPGRVLARTTSSEQLREAPSERKPKIHTRRAH